MPRNERRSTSSNNGDQADRYRRAADDALQQLDWAIGYLHGIRKVEISRALARNRSDHASTVARTAGLHTVPAGPTWLPAMDPHREEIASA